jgi:phage terminase small subunit
MAKNPVQYVTADIILENGLTLAQELWCMRYVESGDAKEAYKQAYGSEPTSKQLTALIELPAAIKRVSVLYNQRVAVMQNSARVDVDLLVRELEQARQIAIQEREASAAIAATMGKAKLHGLLVDRREISLKRPEDMTEAELRQVLGLELEDDLKLIEHESEGAGGGATPVLPAETA